MLATAFLRAAASLGLPASTVRRLSGIPLHGSDRSDTSLIDPASACGLRALRVIQCYAALRGLMGDSGQENLKHWMHTPNTGTGGVPAVQILTPAGLEAVTGYLAAMQQRA